MNAHEWSIIIIMVYDNSNMILNRSRDFCHKNFASIGSLEHQLRLQFQCSPTLSIRNYYEMQISTEGVLRALS